MERYFHSGLKVHVWVIANGDDLGSNGNFIGKAFDASVGNWLAWKARYGGKRLRNNAGN